MRHAIRSSAILPEVPAILAKSLGDVFDMAQQGSSPEQCAVVYRALAKDHPEHARMLNQWAFRWEQMGPFWTAL